MDRRRDVELTGYTRAGGLPRRRSLPLGVLEDQVARYIAEELAGHPTMN